MHFVIFIIKESSDRGMKCRERGAHCLHRFTDEQACLQGEPVSLGGRPACKSRSHPAPTRLPRAEYPDSDYRSLACGVLPKPLLPGQVLSIKWVCQPTSPKPNPAQS